MTIPPSCSTAARQGSQQDDMPIRIDAVLVRVLSDLNLSPDSNEPRAQTYCLPPLRRDPPALLDASPQF